jgi:DNA-binding SARP family transcriptional activator
VLFGLLGPVEVRADDAAPPAELGSPLQRVLLGLLLTERDRSVSLDRIVDELWGDATPADPEASVHTYVSRLRRVLEPERTSGAPPRTLLRTPAGYRLAVTADVVDAERFAALAAAAHQRLESGDAAAALAAADEALALWRSPVALEDAGDREFAVAARTRLDTLRLTCLEDRLAALLALGKAADVVPEAEALVARHPLRERPWVLLVDALRAVGRTADALARYTEAHRLLDEELGIAPGPALRAAQARALRAGDEPVPEEEAAPSRPGLVGRERELSALAIVLAVPSPRFVLVDGEPGIGKSRLVAEATAVAAAAGARVAWGRCHEDDDAPALWPWRQILAALTGDPEAVLAGPDEGAFAAFERMLRALVDASAGGRVVVVIDDLHWADPASLRLLSFLAVELQHGPVAVLATSRPVEDDPVLAQVRATLVRTHGFAHVDLGPLDGAATAELVAAVAGPDRLDDRAVAELHDRSGGNPFFATELARVLAEGRDGPVPPGVRDVVLRRLAHLPEEARAVLRLAAVAGQRFDVPLLLRAGAADAEALADALDAAEAAHLIRGEGPGRLAFAHTLVRDSLLADLPELRRSRLHARLAAALTTGDPFERAHHLVAGLPFTDTATTVAACAEAAEQAAREHAHENAARWWERALSALDANPAESGTAQRQDLLLRAGTSLARAGSWEAATELLSATIDASLARRDVDTAAAAADQFCRLAGLWFPVAYGSYPEELVGRLEAVLAAAGEGDDAARVRALSALATACHYGPDRSRPRRESDRAVELARRTGRVDLLITALSGRLSAVWLPGDEEAQLVTATELLDLAVGPERADLAVLAHARRATARLVLQDVTGADQDLADAWDLARRHELPLLQAQCVSLQAARAMLDGRLDVAMELIDRAWVLTQRTQLYTQTWTDLAMRAFVWIDQGCLAEKFTALPPEASVSGGSEAFPLALALLEIGQPAEAAAVMEQYSAFQAWPMQWDWLSLTCWQARIAAELAATPGLMDEALLVRITDQLLPYADQLALHGGIGALGPVRLHLGRVEAALGRTADAEQHLREAIDVAARHGFRPSLAYARLEVARLLSRLGDAAAAAEAARAREVAEEIGMRRVAAEAARLAHE